MRDTGLHRLKYLIVPLTLLSLVGNLVVLVSPLFMMQVLDRVVPTGNMNTLILLLGLALAALALNAVVEWLRDRSLQRCATWVEHTMSAQVLRGQNGRLGDVATLRGFVEGSAMPALLNLPWLPLFVLALGLIHLDFVWLLLGLAGALSVVTLLSRYLGAGAERIAGQHGRNIQNIAQHLGQIGLLADMMSLRDHLALKYRAHLHHSRRATEEHGQIRYSAGAISRFLRAGGQIGSLAIGAALVTQGDITAGGMIGASLITAKSLAIFEAALAAWPQLAPARAAYKALTEDSNATRPGTELGTLSGALQAQNLIFPRGGGAPPRLDRVSVSLAPGECLAILGDSGSGKTTLLNALSGADPAPIGAVLLDGTDLRVVGRATRAQQIGYLPQRADLLMSTLADNIARLAPDKDDQAIIEAARLAGVHGLISSLPNGYDTDLGAERFLLSEGQLQRVALARAIYGRPKYLFLDEPNALLDGQGERQLADALARLKQQGTTIVMVVHRAGIIGLADKIMVMDQGRAVDFGTRAEVLGRLGAGDRVIRLPASNASLQDLHDWVTRQFTRDGDALFAQRAATVAGELFQFACVNGRPDPERVLRFQFAFEDDHNCTLTLHEPARAPIEAKVQKVRAHIAGRTAQDVPLSPDETALTNVIRLSEAFQHRQSKQSSDYLVRIGSDHTPLREVAE